MARVDDRRNVAARASARRGTPGVVSVSGPLRSPTPSKQRTAGSGQALAAGSLPPLGLVALLVGVLRLHVRRRWKGGLHTEACRRGQWIDGYSGPDGAPCSAGCETARFAIGVGLGYLALEGAR